MSANWSPRARYFTLTIIVVGLAFTAWYVRPVFQPLIIAGLVAYVLNPVVDFLKSSARMSHRLAVNLVYFITLAIVLAIPATVVPILVGELQELLSDLTGLPVYVQNLFSQPLVIGGFTLSLTTLVPDITEPLSTLINLVPESTLKLIESTSRNVAWLLVIIITIYYLLIDWDRLREWFFRLPPAQYQPDVRRLYDEITEIWSAYMRGQIALMALLVVIYTIAWLAIGLPGALVLGALAGVLNIIPELGPFVAVTLAVAVALVEGSTFLPISNLWFSVLVLGVYSVLNYAKNIWLLPRVVGRSLKLHDGVVFVAIIAALIIQGVLGVLIVVPLLASLMVVGRYLRRRVLGLPPFPEDEMPSGPLPVELEPEGESVAD
ncbi:MAG: AI-2E family transporter [Chloroflexi bacterium]|nr:AI-2E family transporter [Chloroflexota bacterium]